MLNRQVLTLSDAGTQHIEYNPLFKFLHIFLPPILDGYNEVTSDGFFDVKGIVFVCLHMAPYAVVVAGVKLFVLKKRKWN